MKEMHDFRNKYDYLMFEKYCEQIFTFPSKSILVKEEGQWKISENPNYDQQLKEWKEKNVWQKN